MSSTQFANILERHFKMNQDYLLDLVQDLLESEKNLYATPAPIEVNQDSKVTKKMRKTLVEWMIELSDELKLGYKTKQTSIILLDLTLVRIKIHKNFLQLLGMTCLFIAIKCEESFVYTLASACEHSANTYTREEISTMEMLILKTLKWKIHYPTPGEIARRLVQLSGAATMPDMPKFFKKIDNFIDLSISEHDLMTYSPSSIAIASIMCAFGSEQQYVEEWRSLMMNNGIFQFDFNPIDTLYLSTMQVLEKYRPDYFTPTSAKQTQQDTPQNFTEGIQHQELSQSVDFNNFSKQPQMGVEYTHQMSLMSLCSQETCMETTTDDLLLEYSSQTGTPSKKDIQDFRNSLLDTEKLMKENPRTMGEEKDDKRDSISMDEEKCF